MSQGPGWSWLEEKVTRSLKEQTIFFDFDTRYDDDNMSASNTQLYVQLVEFAAAA